MSEVAAIETLRKIEREMVKAISEGGPMRLDIAVRYARDMARDTLKQFAGGA